MAVMQETVADELEEAYRSHIWDPSLRHVQKQKQGVTAARVELTSLFTKVSLIACIFYAMYHSHREPNILHPVAFPYSMPGMSY